jgi:stage V sporulation protein AD
MAPAAVETIKAHLQDFNKSFQDYDLIVTGDLGKVGHEIARDLFFKEGFETGDRFQDCGMLIYGDHQNAMSGGSGCACSATVSYGHIFNRMRRGELQKVLIAATGSLLSPISYQQNESIPCICHAVSIEWV